MAFIEVQQNGLAGDPIRRDAPRWSGGAHTHGFSRVEYKQHDVVFYEGDAAKRLYEVVDGTVMLFKLLPDGRRQVVDILRKGALIGLQTTGVYDCSAETLTPVVLRVIENRELDACAELRERVTRCALEQMQTMHEHAVLLGRKSAFERVASYIMRFVPKRGGFVCPGPDAEDADSYVVELAMTRQEIADYLGLTIETVSRVFSEMRRRGLIRLEKQDRVHINNVCQLCHVTGMH